MRVLLPSVFTIITAVGTASADEICGANLKSEQLVGTYDLSLGDALLFGEGRTVPLTNSQNMQATIALVGDQLTLESGGYALDLEIVGADYKPDWQWEPMSGIMELSSDDFSLVFDCPVKDFPRVVGQGSIVTDGVEFVSNYYLLVSSVGDSGAEMFGALHGEGGGIALKRAVRMTAN